MAYTTIDDPTKYFDTTLWSTQDTSIDTLSFQPDWVWLKSRSNADTQVVFDSVRGVNKRLSPSEVTGESTTSDELTAFNSDGFTLGTGDNVNRASQTMAAWSWLGGGSASSDSNGSITSSVSANTTSGFSIVSYTGNGTAGATVGHGLGAVPNMIWVKRVNAEGGWVVFHEAMGNTHIIEVHAADASQSSSAAWNNTSPSSSVFTLGDYTSTNTNGGTYIAYCFTSIKGYSKIGAYTGTGSVRTYVHTGFKPAFLLSKGTHSGGHSWNLLDSKRSPINPADKRLTPDTNDAEATTTQYDFLSNGFRAQATTGAINTSGAVYIYMAFAESPFVSSGGVPTTAR
jgi:hypothetical protein